MKTLKLIAIFSSITVCATILSTFILNKNDNKILRANNINLTLKIDMNNAPQFGSGEFLVQTNYGNNIWFEYKNFGISDSTIQFKKGGYLKNLTPIHGIKKFEYDKNGVNSISSYMSSSTDDVGSWYDGCKTYSMQYQIENEHISGDIINGKKWESNSDKPINFILWSSGATSLFFLKTTSISITYTC